MMGEGKDDRSTDLDRKIKNRGKEKETTQMDTEQYLAA